MLKLRESDERLTGLCRQIEARVVLPSALGEIELPVTTVPNFAGMSTQGPYGSSLAEHNEAAYQIHEKVILVNESRFFDLASPVAMGTLAHEAGHRVCAEARDVGYNLGYGNLDEEIVADKLAADWGFYDEICELRRSNYDDDYCVLLANLESTEASVEEMNRWHQGYIFEKMKAQQGLKY